MGRIVVSENVTLDGVIQDPAGDEGFRVGGWIGRFYSPSGSQPASGSRWRRSRVAAAIAKRKVRARRRAGASGVETP